MVKPYYQLTDDGLKFQAFSVCHKTYNYLRIRMDPEVGNKTAEHYDTETEGDIFGLHGASEDNFYNNDIQHRMSGLQNLVGNLQDKGFFLPYVF